MAHKTIKRTYNSECIKRARFELKMIRGNYTNWQLARDAGVSEKTVIRAIAQNPYVTKEKLSRIMCALNLDFALLQYRETLVDADPARRGGRPRKNPAKTY